MRKHEPSTGASALEVATTAGYYARIVAAGGTLTQEQAAELSALLVQCVGDLGELEQHRARQQATRAATAARVRRHRVKRSAGPSAEPPTREGMADVTDVTVTSVTSVTPVPSPSPRPSPAPPTNPSTPPLTPPRSRRPAAAATAGAVPAADAAAGKRPRAENWVAEFGADWQDVRGGVLPHGRLGKALKPLVDRDGADSLRDAWRRFVRSPKAQYGPEYFAANLADFAPAHPGQPGAASLATDPAQRLLDALDTAGLTHNGVPKLEYRRRVFDLAPEFGYEPDAFGALIGAIKPWDLERHTFEPDRRKDFARRLAAATAKVAA